MTLTASSRATAITANGMLPRLSNPLMHPSRHAGMISGARGCTLTPGAVTEGSVPGIRPHLGSDRVPMDPLEREVWVRSKPVFPMQAREP